MSAEGAAGASSCSDDFGYCLSAPVLTGCQKELIFRKPRTVNDPPKPRQFSSPASASPRVESEHGGQNQKSDSSIYSMKLGSDSDTNIRRSSAAAISIAAFGGRNSPAAAAPLSQSLPDDQILAPPTTSMQLEVSPQPIFLARSSVSSLRKLASQGANQQRTTNNVSNSAACSTTSTNSGGSSPTVTAETFRAPTEIPFTNSQDILNSDKPISNVDVYNNQDRHVNSSHDHHRQTITTQQGAAVLEPNPTISNNSDDPNNKESAASWSWWPWSSSSTEPSTSEPYPTSTVSPPYPDRSPEPFSDQASPPAEDQNSAEKENNTSDQPTSWVSYLWPVSNSTKSTENSQTLTMARRASQKDSKPTDEVEPREEGTKSPPPSPVIAPEVENAGHTSGGNNGARYWAFWARSSGKDSEFAMSDTSTEHNPHKAKQMEEVSDLPADQMAEIKAATKSNSKGKKSAKVRLPSIVTPTSDMCYTFYSSTARIKSSLSKISHYFLPRPAGSSMTKLYDPLYRTAPVKINKVVVIGVHGFFPAKVVRAVIGDPTGTSIKFVNEAAKSVERWASEKGISVQIEKIALEGEGKVLKRVETLYQMLCNWLHLIDEADFIYFAAHSQGTPVAVHLLAKLVEDGHVENKRVALLGMAGISLGPIYGLDQKLLMRAISQIESASLQELFEFQNPESTQSRKYIESLRTIIAHNAKIVFVGSVNDQLVPLYSSICAHASHPNIFRSAFIDSQNVAPEFISTVISIALQLRNIGSSDHGLIREISSALPGALTSGGHSRIYDEGRVYDLLMRHALETTDAPSNVPLRIDTSFEIPKNNHNPYLLPWSMRGLVNEASMRPSFSEQLELLHTEFKQWTPEAKPLKDLKYRLSAIQSRL